jgi:hypothetical protein
VTTTGRVTALMAGEPAESVAATPYQRRYL